MCRWREESSPVDRGIDRPFIERSTRRHPNSEWLAGLDCFSHALPQSTPYARMTLRMANAADGIIPLQKVTGLLPVLVAVPADSKVMDHWLAPGMAVVYRSVCSMMVSRLAGLIVRFQAQLQPLSSLW